MSGRSRLVVWGLVFGLVMRVAAGSAAHRPWEWLQWVVNWGALWLVVPFVVGRRADRALSAAVFGAITAAAEVAAYYGPENVPAFKLLWLVTGAIAGAGIAEVGWRTRQHPCGLLLVPILLILEPIGTLAILRILGRSLGWHWFWSFAAEATIGALLAAFVLKLQRRSPRDLSNTYVS